jgi:hypothetical protein
MITPSDSHHPVPMGGPESLGATTEAAAITTAAMYIHAAWETLPMTPPRRWLSARRHSE